MILKKLVIRNIRSYKDFEIVFPRGSMLLAGDIGAGKTSILLALQFSLFGLQPGQKGSSILRQGEDNAYVALDLEIDGNKIKLERTLKRSRNKSISQSTSIITINDERSELSTSEMKNRVIGLLNYPKEFAKKSNLLYKFTVYTPQEEMKAIIQERPEIRLDTLRHIFGIDRYKRIKENSQIFLQKIKEEIRIKEALVGEINLLKERLVNEREKKIKLRKELNDLNIEFLKISDQRKEAEEQLSSVQEQLKEKQRIDSESSRIEASLNGKQDLRSRLEKEIASMQRQIEQKIDFSEERLRSVSSLLEKHRILLDDLNTTFLELNSEISVLNSKKDGAFSLKEKVEGLENCPTCFQTVSAQYKEKISKRTQFDIEDIDRELEQKLIDKKKIVRNIETEKELIKGYDKDKAELEKDKIKSQHQKSIDTKIKSDVFVLERTLKEIEDLNKTLSELRISSEALKEITKIYEEKSKVFQNIFKLSREKEIQLVERNKELEILTTQLEELEKEIQRKEKIKEHMNYLRELQDWLQEKFLFIVTLTEKNVMAKLRSEFSKIFAEWFSLLVSSDMSVRLDEDFTPIITNQGFDMDYDFLSGGERTAVALAYRLALNQILNSLLSKIKTKDIVILDEPTDGFSAEQLAKMRDIFEQLKSEQMILVSHEPKIEDFVDHVIRIKKEGTSRIEATD